MDPRELVLRRTIPVIINSYNQPTYLKQLLSKLREESFSNLYVLDQASTNPELLSYYYSTEFPPGCIVLYLGNNFGPHHFYTNRMYEMFMGTPVIYSDPDIYFDKLAPNFMLRLFEISNRYSVHKVGCALQIPSKDEIADLKFNISGRQYAIQEWEQQYWTNQLELDVYDAPVDTTFHLFQPRYFTQAIHIGGLRVAGEGFTVKHMPWYKNNGVPQAELDFYYQRSAHSAWQRSPD